MATAPNWGEGRFLRVKVIADVDDGDLQDAVNAFLEALGQEKIIDITWTVDVHGDPAVEYFYCFITYVRTGETL
jgi:hypothetical protein